MPTLDEQFKNLNSSHPGEQTAPENVKKKTIETASNFMFLLYQQKAGEMSGVGFEPTPKTVDCDLNAAP